MTTVVHDSYTVVVNLTPDVYELCTTTYHHLHTSCTTVIHDPPNIIGELLEIDGNIVVVRDTSHCSSQDAEYNEDDYMLMEFLKGINMESLFEHLKASHVTFRSLQYLKKEDLKEAVPPLGLRVEFREKLFAWKKRELGIDDETMSVPSKIGEWWKRNELLKSQRNSVRGSKGIVNTYLEGETSA
ncbi:uncharacterized protein [Musca autumnalis]|uniref:uncharacterized protein n=1 Tax=Musca autumnalis TaxID=221902 RepID=UPI003CFA3DC6